MLLHRLREYSQRFEPAPSMYVATPIKWLVDLDQDGAFLSFVRLEGEGKRGKRGKEFLAPHVGRSSTMINPKLLADRADYALGIPRSGASTRARSLHPSFLDLLRECASSTNEPTVGAVLKFLESFDPSSLNLPVDMDPSDVVTFRVSGVLPINLPSVRQFWAARHERSVAAVTPMTTQCLICGRQRPPVARHRIKIKGIPEGQPSGMTIVSANKPAFESYGLRASHIAPICSECTEAYANGANLLIRDDRTRYVIGPLMYLFWTKDGSAPAFVSLLRDPQPDEVKELLRAAQTGQAGALAVDETFFYATALSASGGRVVVRDWLEITIGEARKNLKRYFERQRLVEWDGREGRFIGLFPLMASLVVRADDLPPHIPVAFFRHALAKTPLPLSLLVHAVERSRAEQRVTRPRAAIIKMVLLSMHPEEGNSMEQLDPATKHPAYICGRVFAVIESAQRAALGDVGSTITDRYFSAASSTPAYVLGKLVSDARKAHFGKLRRQKPAVYYALDQRLTETLQSLSTFPATLTLEEQGRFVLGYYHQRAADRTAARARRELRELAPEESTEPQPEKEEE